MPNLLEMDYQLYEDKVEKIDESLFRCSHTQETFERGLAFAKALKYRNTISGYYIVKELTPTKVRLETVGVAKKYQHKGFGRILVEDALEEAKKRGYKRVFLFVRSTNKKAIALYQKFGFGLYSYIDNYLILAYSIGKIKIRS